MAWCHQATSHYLIQCWPSSMSYMGHSIMTYQSTIITKSLSIPCHKLSNKLNFHTYFPSHQLPQLSYLFYLIFCPMTLTLTFQGHSLTPLTSPSRDPAASLWSVSGWRRTTPRKRAPSARGAARDWTAPRWPFAWCNPLAGLCDGYLFKLIIVMPRFAKDTLMA